YIDKVKHKPLAIALTIAFIGVITALDYFTGAEMSFSVFYLIPISILAVSRTSNKRLIVIISVVAAICWYAVEVNSNAYSHLFFPIWNAIVRLIIFVTIGVLVFSFRIKQDKLNESNAKLKHLNDEKNKFIGVAAHDIRNPISGIYSFSDLLLNDKDTKMNEDELEIVGMIKSLSQNVLDLIKHLLDVSKIESGKIELHYKHQDYLQFIKKQVYVNQLLANQKNIKIVLNTEKEQLMADFDDHHMSEVINNLISNALKYSEKNSIITINVSNTNDTILTEVIDTGRGIPLEEQQKLFNYFQKTSTKPTDGETSTGLGLAIVKKLIDAFEGQIAVKSNINEGSNFYFTFPVQKK
ncbi:MAG: HAMP domain-containing histidine kinase, partial [Gelidibacter sp.]|nr:HAMP domain-containing histidine kinase [Gelidibacter sp.]